MIWPRPEGRPSNNGKTLLLLSLVSAFAAVPLVAGSGAYFQRSAGTVTVGNVQVELVFSSANGSLLDLIDETTGQDLISQKVPNYNGLIFSYATPTNATPQQSGGYLASSVSLSPAYVSTGVQLTIHFGQFAATPTALNVSATLVVTVDNSSPLTSWQLSIANHDQITIEAVSLPSICGIGQLSNNPANDYMAYPSLSGMLFQDPAHNLVLNGGWGQIYPGGYSNMQFLAYYSKESGAGLYLASQDNAGYAKTINFALLGSDWMQVNITYYPTFQAGADVTVPFTVTLGVFHGDWFDAASLYRAWAVQQQWAQGGPLATRTDVPDWYKNTGMMGYKQTITQYAAEGQSYASLAQVASAWQQELKSTPLVDWIFWENQGAWFDIPDFFPPSQGWPAFDSAVSATHAAGGTLMVEPSTSYATVGGPSWGTLQATASQQADGSLYLHQLLQVNQSGQSVPQTDAQMDPSQPWHDALISVTSQLQQNGIDLIHMDGNPYQQGLCYASNHSHPPGGGNWWFQDYAQIYSDVRTAGRAVNPNFAMGGEFYAEPYLGLTDSGQDETNTGLDPSAIGAGAVLDSTKVSYIPLWQAVYHDYTLTYSMLSFISGIDLPYYRRGLAIPLVWGEIPMIFSDDTVPPFTPWQLSVFNSTLVQYVQRIVSLRTTYGYPFVVLGRMLRPPQPTVPAYTVPAVTDGIPYTGVNTAAFSAPSILSSAWQSPQGDAALIFTNMSDSAVSFSWTVSADDVPLDSTKLYNLYIFTNGVCTSAQQAVYLPYTLSLSTNSTDVVMALFSQPAAGGAAPFSGCGVSPPVITSVVNAASFQAGIAPATWITIQGTNFGPSSPLLWSTADFNSNDLPVSLGGVSVQVNGQPAYVEYVSSTQINALAPGDVATGPVAVDVTTPNGQTYGALAPEGATSPALFTFGPSGRYAAAVHADGTYVGPPGLLGSGVVTSPAQPGEVISLFGTGFGPTAPATPTGQLVEHPSPLAVTPGVSIGNAAPTVLWSGIVSSGLYQFNVQIPPLAAGDAQVMVQIGVSQSQSGVYVTIGGGNN